MASSALAQATGSGMGAGSTGPGPGSGGTAPGAGAAAGLAGSWSNFWWIVAIVVVLVLAAIWFFTRVTARWIAQPPKAAFVMRLRPGRLPCQAARQLPDQSTTLWVDPSSTGDPRRLGALGNAG